MLHDAECELHQKLLIADVFPGILIIGNIFVTINATKVKRYFLDLHYKSNQLVYIAKDNFKFNF